MTVERGAPDAKQGSLNDSMGLGAPRQPGKGTPSSSAAGTSALGSPARRLLTSLGGIVPEHSLHNDNLFASSPNSLMMYEQERQDMKNSQHARTLSTSFGSPSEVLDMTSPTDEPEAGGSEAWRAWSPAEQPVFKMDLDSDCVLLHHERGPTLAALNSGDNMADPLPMPKVQSSSNLSDNSLLDDIEDIIGTDNAKDDKAGALPADPYKKPVVDGIGGAAAPLVLAPPVVAPVQQPTTLQLLPVKLEPVVGSGLSQSLPQNFTSFTFFPGSSGAGANFDHLVKQEPASPASRFKELSITSQSANQSPASVLATSPPNPLKRDYTAMLSQSAPARRFQFPSPHRKSPTAETMSTFLERNPIGKAPDSSLSVKTEPTFGDEPFKSGSRDGGLAPLDVLKEDEDDDRSDDDDSDDELITVGTEAYDIDEILEDTSVSNTNKKEKRYFWQYNTQSKGPKGKRLCKSMDADDPYEVSQFEDPVFDPELNQQKFKHSGKARKGDGNDITPNPYRLYQLGHELRRINGSINSMAPANEMPQAARNKSRKEKNKLASRACRLKKKAQHEAFKVKLHGLETEHRKLATVLHTIRTVVRQSLQKDKVPMDAKLKLDRLIQCHLSGQVAGNTTEYVNSVIRSVAKGDKTGGIHEL